MHRPGFCRGEPPVLRVSVSPTSVRQTQPLSVSPPPPPRPSKLALGQWESSQEGWSQEACECIGRQFGKRCYHDRSSLRSERGKVARLSAGAPERRWQLPARFEGKITFLELKQLAYEMQPAARKILCGRPARSPVIAAAGHCAAPVLAAGPGAPPSSPETPVVGANGDEYREEESSCSDDDTPVSWLPLVI